MLLLLSSSALAAGLSSGSGSGLSLTNFIPASQIIGTSTNDNAPAGGLGEYVVSRVTSATNVPATTGQSGDATTISLTAGDWDISAAIYYTLNGATVTATGGGIGTATGNSLTGAVVGDNYFAGPPPTAAYGIEISIPAYRVQPTATTTYYLKENVAFSAGTPQYQCRISARRVR